MYDIYILITYYLLTEPAITSALWAAAFIINVTQFALAYLLFSVVNKVRIAYV